MPDPEFHSGHAPETLIICRHGHYPTNAKTFGAWAVGDALPDIPDLETDATMPLDAKGQEQSQRFGAFMVEHFPDLRTVLSSDWLRAVQTAQHISKVYETNGRDPLSISTSDALHERNRGIYRGMPKAWLETQPDYLTYLESPTTWIPNQHGKPEERGETLLQKATALRRAVTTFSNNIPSVATLPQQPLLVTTHGEVVGGAAMIAFGGFGDDQLKRPLPGNNEWMPRTVANCQASIFTDFENGLYRSFMAVDASKEILRITDMVEINT